MKDSRNVQTGSVAVGGTRLSYDELGKGPTLVLIPGVYMYRHMWDDQFAAFAAHHRVIRYDIRGFGESPLPQEPYTDRHDLYELLTHLGVGRATVLGLSLGGIIALEFALEHPELVEL
jgi:3-oxoadipate enol-lactonase